MSQQRLGLFFCYSLGWISQSKVVTKKCPEDTKNVVDNHNKIQGRSTIKKNRLLLQHQSPCHEYISNYFLFLWNYPHNNFHIDNFRYCTNLDRHLREQIDRLWFDISPAQPIVLQELLKTSNNDWKNYKYESLHVSNLLDFISTPRCPTLKVPKCCAFYNTWG